MLKKKSCICFADLEKALDRVPRKVLEWAMIKKGTPEDVVRSMMSLHEGENIRLRHVSELSEISEVKVGMHQRSVQIPFLLAVVVDVVTEFCREGALSELLYANDLALMGETIKGLRNKFLKWKEAIESKGLKINLRKTKLMVSGGITKDSMSKNKVYPCGACDLKAKADSILCLQCGKWIHCRYAREKMVTPKD